MNLVEKIKQVEIKVDTRISEDDRDFCERQQRAYDAARETLKEMAFIWTDSIARQKAIFEDKYGESDRYAYYLGNGKKLDAFCFRDELECLHRQFINKITSYYANTYSVELSAEKIIEQLLPVQKDEEPRKKMNAAEVYHKAMCELALQYTDVLDRIIIQLDGRSFQEKAFLELRGRCRDAVWNGCKPEPQYVQQKDMYCTWVVSSAISIRNNWDGVLANYDLPYVFVERLRDLERIRQGDFVLITTNVIVKYRRQIKYWMRIHGYKVNLVLDESDEITNPSSARTKAVLSCFRRCRAKLLTTGTSTRNNIVEFAPQLELLYNNSFNMISWAPYIYSTERDGDMTTKSNPYYGAPIPAYRKGYALFSAAHLPEKITVFGIGQWTQDIYNAEVLRDILDKTVITRSFKEIVGREIRRLHQVPIPFTGAERDVCKKAIEEFNQLRANYFATTGNSRKDAMMRLIQQITLLLRISAAPNTLMEYTGDLPGKLRKTTEMIARWDQEIVAVGVRHAVILNAYADAIRKAMPDRPLFLVTGATTSFAKRRALRKTLRESKNGILLCTQQSLPSSVNFEFVNKIIIPELHYNNAQMSQFYMRFVRYTSTEWKDIYFLTYEDSIEANLLQMVLAKERINLFMKGADTDLDEV